MVKKPPSETPAMGGRLRILMVEDNAADGDLLERMVWEGLPDARIVRDVSLENALQSLQSAAFDAVLLNLSRSNSQGLDAVGQLAANEDVAVIVLTDNDDSQSALEALKAGAQDYLCKNEVQPRLLARCIKYGIERKQGDRTLREKEEQLLQKQRIEALGELAGGVAHEFNNLLQIIQTYGSFAIDGLDAQDQRHSDLSEVLSAADRAGKLTSQLLGFSRRRALHCSTIQPNEVITGLMQMLGPLLGEHIQVTLGLGQDVGSLSVDTTLFEQMLTNICLNARDALPQGGEIKISTERVVLREEYTDCIPDLRPGPYVAISVTDNGCGMTPDIVAKVFDPFFTTKEVGKGTGLGLSMVYGVVKQHGGTINVYSEPGLGTTLRMYLPAAAEESFEHEEELIHARLPGGNETILVAEDELGVQRATQRLLERAGYSTLCAADGADAIRLFERHADEISAVVLDAVMPKLMGRHVYEAIRMMKPDMPVLFCTGFDRETGLFDYAHREGLPIISKPFQPAALLQALRKAIDEPRHGPAPAGESCLLGAAGN